MHSCLYEGEVQHRRFAPHNHEFHFPLFLTYLDLDELEEVFYQRWLWSTRKPAPAWFRRSDYLGDPNVSLKTAVCDLVAEQTGRCPAGPIRLLTHLRYFGFVFNPVSFYYCFDTSDRSVETIVAEITNTPWGERHAYVLPRNQNISDSGALQFQFGKNFHVSPFMPMDIQYNWVFGIPDKNLWVYMENRGHDGKVFDVTMNLHRTPLTAINCARVLISYPLMTVQVIAMIYLQALRLFLKRTRFYPHPNKLKSYSQGGAESEKPL